MGFIEFSRAYEIILIIENWISISTAPDIIIINKSIIANISLIHKKLNPCSGLKCF